MNRFPHKVFAVFLAVIIAAFVAGPGSSSAQPNYDRYGATYKEVASISPFRKVASEFLTYPFEILRWPVDKALVTIDKYYLDKKAQWIYEEIQNYGVTPDLSIFSFGRFGAGADIDFVRMARLKGTFPDLIAEGWFHWTSGVNTETGARLGWERIAGTGLHAYGLIDYQDRPEEHFYGLGPESSRGEGTSYKMEQTTLEAKAGYSGRYGLSLDSIFAYRNVNISRGRAEGMGQIDPVFFPQVIPGLEGDEIITMGTELCHDSRDQKENSTMGGLERFAFSYNEGLDDSEASYFKYVLEASRFISLGSKRRVLAGRFYGEHNDEINNREIPFHQMAKLGGYGDYPRLSHTLRGFDFNRFFDKSAVLVNLEYRYTVWESKEWKLDSVAFWDEGMVFPEFSDFKFSRLRESYGGGFRVSVADHVLLSLEIAHGDEGTNFYAKSSAPF